MKRLIVAGALALLTAACGNSEPKPTPTPQITGFDEAAGTVRVTTHSRRSMRNWREAWRQAPDIEEMIDAKGREGCALLRSPATRLGTRCVKSGGWSASRCYVKEVLFACTGGG